MSKKVKITKREIKEDKFATFVFKAKDYIQKNWYYFVGGLALIVVVIFAVTYYQGVEVKEDQKAADIFSRAESEYRSKNYQLAIVDFKSIVDDYGASHYNQTALFSLGNSYFESSDFANAITTFEKYIKNYGDKDIFFTSSAMAGIAESKILSGNLVEGAKKYQEIADKYPDLKMSPEYLVKAMRAYLNAKNDDGAKQVMAELEQNYKKTYSYHIGQRLVNEYNVEN